jgi:hypothetical protein
MDRRKFLSTLIGGVAATAAVRTFPFRVFSFPQKIETGNWGKLHVCPYPGILRTPHINLGRGAAITPEMIRRATEQMRRAMSIGPEPPAMFGG